MKYLILLALVFSFGVALADEPVILGCTNPNALNYNSEANKDDNTCNTGGGGNPLAVSQPAWGGITGFQVSELYVSLKPGESFGDEYCPTWFSPDVFGYACWTFILK